MKKINSLVSRLSCIALTLPGLCQEVEAGRIEETYNADFLYGHYSESNQRMSVDIFEAAIASPIGKSMTASLNLVRDTISGASPMFNLKNSQSKAPQQILSGASIREQRDEIKGGLTYFWDKTALSVGGGYSREHDYLARFFNTQFSLDFNKKLTTINLGASVSLDEIEPTGFNYRKHKSSQQYLMGISQVLDKNSIIKSNITLSYHEGFLSDPYKLVFFENAGIQSDKRPGHRFEWAWLTQYIRHFKSLNHAALHVDYRYYQNDWNVHAHTAELSWHQPVIDDWQLIPRFRYYSQDSASFYQPYVVANDHPNFYSSDYRLAGFGALSGGIKLAKTFEKLKGIESLKIQAGVEYYQRQSSFQLGGSSAGAFDNFSYYLVNASFNLRF